MHTRNITRYTYKIALYISTINSTPSYTDIHKVLMSSSVT